MEKVNKRILALDILRGISVAGMALVNHPGSWKAVYAPLLHARWNGLTPTDLIFPFFIFIMGISMYISLRKYHFECTGPVLLKVVKRTFVIFFIGLALSWFGNFCSYWAKPAGDIGLGMRLWNSIWTFDHLRIPGVMQRLALCYGIGTILTLNIKHQRIPYLAFSLLAGYFIVLWSGNGFAYDKSNICSIVDHAVLTSAHLQNDHGIDLAGILGTIPSVANVLLGFWVGQLLFGSGKPAASRSEQLDRYLIRLFLVGSVLAFSGLLLSYGCPINKKIWSPTFVLATCGFAATSLALLIWIIDVKGCKRWSRFFEVFGINPLFMYVLGSMLGKVLQVIPVVWYGESYSLRSFLYKECLSPVFGDYGASFAYALIFVVINWIIGYQLYKRKIYIKI